MVVMVDDAICESTLVVDELAVVVMLNAALVVFNVLLVESSRIRLCAPHTVANVLPATNAVRTAKRLAGVIPDAIFKTPYTVKLHF